MNNRKKNGMSREDEKAIIRKTEKQPDATSENLIVDKDGKPQPYKPGVADRLHPDSKHGNKGRNA